MACSLAESRTDEIECFKMRLPLSLASGTHYIRRLFGGGPKTLETKCSNLLNRCHCFKSSIWKNGTLSKEFLVKHFLNNHNEMILYEPVSLCNNIGLFLVNIPGASNHPTEGWMVAETLQAIIDRTTNPRSLIAWSVLDIKNTTTENAEGCAVVTCLIYKLSDTSLAILNFLNETGIPSLLSSVHNYDVSCGRPGVLSHIDYPNLERLGFYNLTPKFRCNYRKGSATPIDIILKEMRHHV